MVEYLQIGEVEEAQALLDAAGCTCPSGKLWRGVFDERGVEYNLEDDHRQIHDWLVFPPTGLAPEKPEGQNEGWSEASSEGRIKGKGKVVESEIKMKSLKKYRVRCRFRDPDKDPDLMISMVEGETIGSLMEKVGEITQVSSTAHCRSRWCRLLLRVQLQDYNRGRWGHSSLLSQEQFFACSISNKS